MSPKNVTATIYDPKLQTIFEDLVIEIGLKINFNIITYLIETRKSPPTFLQRIGLKPVSERKVLHILTNQPGEIRPVFDRYKARIIKEIPPIEEVIMSEVKDQQRILRGIKRRLKQSK